MIYIWLRFVVCGWERLVFDDSRLAMRILRSAKVRATRAALTSARIHRHTHASRATITDATHDAR